jgi:hypothetical protein
MYRIAIYMMLMLAGVFSSCQDEEEFKIPTDVSFQVDINRNASTNGRLQFSQGHITLASFAFDGRREEGGDVYFEKSYERGLLINFAPGQPIDALKFQIPQGNYNRIEVELETYDDFESPGLVVVGSYLNSNGVLYPLRFEAGSSLDFEVQSKEQSGNTQIVLRAGTAANAIIKLDPVRWFSAVPSSYLDNAVLNVEEDVSEGEVEIGTSYILINEETNEEIYEIIMSRIELSTETVFYQ